MLHIISFPTWILFGIIFPMIVYGTIYSTLINCIDAHNLYIKCNVYFPDELYYGGVFSLSMVMKLYNIKPLVDTIQMLYVFPDESFVQLDLHELPNQDPNNPNNPSFFLHITDPVKVHHMIHNPHSWTGVTPDATSTDNEHKLVLGIDKHQLDLNNKELSNDQKVEIIMTMTLENSCWGPDYNDYSCYINMAGVDVSRLPFHLRFNLTLQNFPNKKKFIYIRGIHSRYASKHSSVKLDRFVPPPGHPDPSTLHFVKDISDVNQARHFLESASYEDHTLYSFRVSKYYLFDPGYKLSGNEIIHLEINQIG